MRTLWACALAALAFAAAPAAADRPDDMVRIIVPFPAGAAADNAARVIARKLGEYWGSTVLVDNRPGVTGMQAVATAPADGDTLLLGAGSGIVTSPLLNPKLPYSPQRDFTPIGRVLTIAPLLTVHPSLGVTSLPELIALARRKPGVLNYSSSGIGAPNHLAMELLQAMTGTHMVHIPYKGAAPSVTELIGGYVQLGINAVPSVLQAVNTGRLTPLAVAAASRARALPDLPTFAEAGVPGFDYTIWYALFAPAKTPANIVSRLSADLQRALRDADVARQLLDQGSEPAPSTAEELSQFIKEDTARWAKIIKERNLKLPE